MDKATRDAMLRSMLVAISPLSVDELLMVADALRLWHANPGLRSEILAKRELDAKPMMTRCAVVLALAKVSLTPPDDVPEDYKP